MYKQDQATFEWEDTYEVRGLSCSIDMNQTLALVGRSGCGKSTTAEAFAGLGGLIG